MAESMRIVFTITDYSLHLSLYAIYEKLHLPFSFVTHGHGMADSVILDYLGFGENKKIVAGSFLSQVRTAVLFDTLSQELQLDAPGKGIAFSIPISGMTTFIASLINYDHCQNSSQNKEVQPMSTTAYSHELIIAIVTKGMFPEVKKAANAAGAKGGTLIHALGLGGEEAQQFLGISLQPEKDVILIVVKREEKAKILHAIAEVAGIHTEGKGILFSLPVDQALGLSEVCLPQQ